MDTTITFEEIFLGEMTIILLALEFEKLLALLKAAISPAVLDSELKVGQLKSASSV